MTLITTRPKPTTNSKRTFRPYLHDGELRPEIVIICAVGLDLFDAGCMEPADLAKHMQQTIADIELWGDRPKVASPELLAQFQLLNIHVASPAPDLTVLALLKALATRLQLYVEAEGLDVEK